MNIISKKEARERNLVKYFTGKPCKYGHISERHLGSGRCIECEKTYGASYYNQNKKRIQEKREMNRDYVLERNRIRYYQNREANLARMKADYIANRDSRIEYAKERYRLKKDEILSYKKRYASENPDKVRLASRLTYHRHKDRNKEKKKLYVQVNKAVFNSRNALKRAVIKKAQPLWANKSAITKLYQECEKLTKSTGIKHHVDHIIPINHPLVCGLHNHFNLQILTAEDNLKKSNRFEIE